MAESRGAPTPSLRLRFSAKLASNVLGFLLSFLTAGILPRGLGPDRYGNYQFLTDFFAQAAGFFDMGTSTCFYTRLSRRPDDAHLIRFYLGWVLITCMALGVGVAVSQGIGVAGRVWPGQDMTMVWLALIAVVTSEAGKPLTLMADALGRTMRLEFLRMGQMLFGVGVLLTLWHTGRVTLETALLYRMAIGAALTIPLAWRLADHGLGAAWRVRLDRVCQMDLIREFRVYSQPLVISSALAFVVGMGDRWLLQRFGGSAQQGYYALSSNLGVICTLFTGALTPLVMREMSLAHGRHDRGEMGRLFLLVAPGLYAVAAYFGCFLAVQADQVVTLLGGTQFREATVAMRVMMLYPIYQTYGQLSGSVFCATNDTIRYARITMAMLILGLPMTYFALAPVAHGGLSAGATGLVCKLVLISVVNVNILVFHNARDLGFSFLRVLRVQVTCLGGLTATALAARHCVESLIMVGAPRWAQFLVSGMVYSAAALSLALVLPGLLGLDASTVRREWGTLVEAVRRWSGPRHP